jgi:hypothetical protein
VAGNVQATNKNKGKAQDDIITYKSWKKVINDLKRTIAGSRLDQYQTEFP